MNVLTFYRLAATVGRFQERYVVAIAEEFESLPNNGHACRSELGQVASEIFLTTLKELCRSLRGSWSGKTAFEACRFEESVGEM